MAVMLRCPKCFSEKISRNTVQKKIKKSEVFHCWNCGEENRFEHMQYSYEADFGGEHQEDYVGK